MTSPTDSAGILRKPPACHMPRFTLGALAQCDGTATALHCLLIAMTVAHEARVAAHACARSRVQRADVRPANTLAWTRKRFHQFRLSRRRAYSRDRSPSNPPPDQRGDREGRAPSADLATRRPQRRQRRPAEAVKSRSPIRSTASSLELDPRRLASTGRPASARRWKRTGVVSGVLEKRRSARAPPPRGSLGGRSSAAFPALWIVSRSRRGAAPHGVPNRAPGRGTRSACDHDRACWRGRWSDIPVRNRPAGHRVSPLHISTTGCRARASLASLGFILP